MKRKILGVVGFVLFLAVSAAQADRIRSTTVACPDVKTLEKLEHLGGDF